jgi:hypothetical protein
MPMPIPALMNLEKSKVYVDLNKYNIVQRKVNL